MAKKKPTKKDIEMVVSDLIRQIEFINRKTYEITVTFGLYLDWKKEKDKFNKFIESEVKDAQEKMSKENVNEPGETK